MIRVSIFDDNDSLRETLALVFDATDDLIVTGKYPNALTAVEEVLYNQPDVILMDIDMPGRTGIEAVKLIRAQTTRPKILMLTVFEDVERIFAAISAGAVGYLLKKTPADKIIESIHEVMSGGAAMTPSIALKVLDAFRQPKVADFLLTDKEKEVLQRLVEGDSYKLIAHHCGISMGTVRTHIVNIYEKLHVNSKSEAVAKALKTGLFK
ncbi:response regulator transcription factor [Spirosoma sp. KCTC 42546]|uniref:response regulator transcription factor n=1 Tax=Spirosoma sp. KCTC 42546 TaxID=2520506 RepID=UPI00115B31B2|nr:response regulator transcription factor [Spirosoma sp. KCTC 42546]QDK82856.1 response regulator transcription factor [Spirosoma sp. KCTC 42546]